MAQEKRSARSIVRQVEPHGSGDPGARLSRATRADLSLQVAIAETLSVSETVADAIPRVLEAICRQAGWGFGELWMAEPRSDRLRRLGCWHDPSPAWTAFEEAAGGVTFRRNEALPGHVWAAAAPIWIASLARSRRCGRRELAARLGIQSGFAFPVRRRQDWVGVVALFNRERRNLDPVLMRRMEGLGYLVGLLIENKRTESALRETKLRYRQLFDDDLTGHFVATLEGAVVLCNSAFARMLGFGSPGDVTRGRGFCLLPDEEDRLRILQTLRQQSKIEHRERTLVRRGGNAVTVLETMVGRFDDTGTLVQIQGSLVDITARKVVEESVRELSARLLQLQDEERRRIALELHDTAAQDLAALSINLARLKPEAIPDEGIRTAIEESRALADRCMKEIRTLSYLLHPPHLEEDGLDSTIRWFVEGFTSRSGIAVEVDIPARFGRLSREVEITFFRILQEALSNVHRHSGSKTAQVGLARDRAAVTLEVRDQGRGMPAAVDLTSGAALGVGLRGMRERIRQLGGTLEIQSSDRGVTVRASLPVGLQQ